MKLIKRLQFALHYNFDQEFIVYDFDNQSPVRFLEYKDAKSFSNAQIEYNPKIMVGITKL